MIAEPAPIHLEVIATLKSLDNGDGTFLSELCKIFLNTARTKISAITTDLQTSSWTELREHAHALKSSCGNLGALRMLTLCQELEDLSSSPQNKNKLQETLVELQTEFLKVQIALNTMVQITPDV